MLPVQRLIVKFYTRIVSSTEKDLRYLSSNKKQKKILGGSANQNKNQRKLITVNICYYLLIIACNTLHSRDRYNLFVNHP